MRVLYHTQVHAHKTKRKTPRVSVSAVSSESDKIPKIIINNKKDDKQIFTAVFGEFGELCLHT